MGLHMNNFLLPNWFPNFIMQVPRPVVSSPQSLGQSISVGKKRSQKQLPCYKIEELVLDDKSPLHPAKISHHLASSACQAQSSCFCKWVQSSIPEHKMWQFQHRQIYRSDQYCLHKANYLLTLDHHLYSKVYSAMILGEYHQRNNWFWTQMNIVFYPWHKKTLNYFTKFLQSYMTLVIVLVAILYQKISKRRVLRNTEKMSGKFDFFNMEKCLLSPNNYEADRSCHIG